MKRARRARKMIMEMAMPALAPDERPLDEDFEALGDDLEVVEAAAAVGLDEVLDILLVKDKESLLEEGVEDDVEGGEPGAPVDVLVEVTLDVDAGRAAVVDWA